MAFFGFEPLQEHTEGVSPRLWKWLNQMWKSWRRIEQYDLEYNFAAIAAQGTASVALSAIGVEPEDKVIGITPSNITLGIIYFAYVSSADNITVVANNFSAGSLDPPTNTFTVTVLKYRGNQG